MGEDRTRACAWIPIAAFVLLQVMTASATVQPDGGPAPTFLRNVGGTLFFATYQQDAGGWRLWKSDGTPHGTVILRDRLGLDVELVAVDDRLVFSTRGGLWTSDGTPAGTVLVRRCPSIRTT